MDFTIFNTKYQTVIEWCISLMLDGDDAEGSTPKFFAMLMVRRTHSAGPINAHGTSGNKKRQKGSTKIWHYNRGHLAG